MIDNAFREILPRFAGPLLRIYAFCGLSPNAVSCLGLALAGVSALLCTGAMADDAGGIDAGAIKERLSAIEFLLWNGSL